MKKSAGPQPAHIPALDGLRGVAILLVVTLHAYQIAGLPLVDFRVHHVLTFCWCGVDLFFALSGFLITGILLDAKGSSHYFRNFYARRSLRIFPLYYAVVLLRLFVVPLCPEAVRLAAVSHDIGTGEAVCYLAYFANVWQSFHGTQFFDATLTVTWSLAVEEQFYLCWPLIVAVLGRRQLLALCGVLIPAALLLRMGMLFGGADSWAIYTLTLCRMDTLASGAALAIAWRSPAARAWLARLVLPALLAGFTMLMAAAYLHRSTDNYSPWMATIGFSALDLICAVAVFLAVSGRLRILCVQPLFVFGKFSYAVYLFHYPLLVAIHNQMVGWNVSPPLHFLLLLTVGSAGVLLLAWFSWHQFEERFLSLKRFFPQQEPTNAAVVRAPEVPNGGAPQNLAKRLGRGAALLLSCLGPGDVGLRAWRRRTKQM